MERRKKSSNKSTIRNLNPENSIVTPLWAGTLGTLKGGLAAQVAEGSDTAILTTIMDNLVQTAQYWLKMYNSHGVVHELCWALNKVLKGATQVTTGKWLHKLHELVESAHAKWDYNDHEDVSQHYDGDISGALIEAKRLKEWLYVETIASK